VLSRHLSSTSTHSKRVMLGGMGAQTLPKPSTAEILRGLGPHVWPRTLCSIDVSF
jgi:hypothetical protein